MASQFANLGLSKSLVQAVEALNYSEPTPIQQQAIPFLLQGRNVVGQAQTGTGKTAAFVLPMLENLQFEKGKVKALILTPTRELAIQVTEAANKFAQFTNFHITTVYGGQSYQIQIRQLQRGTDIVVGTPGRLMDLMRKNYLDLSHVKFVVLDEADEMLDMGFAEDVEIILKSIPEERQIALFSATLPHAVKKLAEKYVSNPEQIRINPAKMTVAETEQKYCRVREDNKLAALTRLLELEEIQSALIFTRTKARAQDISDELSSRGFQSESLHGDLSQDRREAVLKRFRAHSISILVATDVAARGLDIDELSHVINFDMPQDADDYVHRIGRTGRAGKKGIAITFITPKEKQRLGQIEAHTHQTIAEAKVPTREEIIAHRDEKFLTKLTDHLGKGKISHERSLIGRLEETSFDLMDIAAAAIQLARAAESSLNIDEFIEPAINYRIISQPMNKGKSSQKQTGYHKENLWSGKKEKSDRKSSPVFSPHAQNGELEPGMVRLKMNLGGTHGIRPGDIVGAIAGEVGIPGRAIGEISIQKDHTFVDVAEKHIRQVLRQSTGQYSLRGKPVILTLAN
jgi:ATP-dependent RNA helicase DeaD